MTRSDPDPLHRPENAYSTDGSPVGPAGSLLDDARAVEMLVRYDEVADEELAPLRADARAAHVLERLRIADRWLEDGLALASGADDEAALTGGTPIDAEELYRYGGGPGAEPPGAEPLDAERRAEIEAYLAEHPDEAGWVEALSRPIPAPLEVEPLTPDEARIRELRHIPGDEVADVSPSIRRVPAWVAWAPLAAAALVLAMALGGSRGRNALDGGLPDSPIVRSAQIDTLLFPRGRVLAPVTGATTYASHPLFEVTPVSGATRYRFELREGAAGAFEEGVIVWSSDTTAPVAASSALRPGAYAWSAWAIVDGMERTLGTLPFTVVVASPGDIMRSAAGLESDARSTREDVRRLHAAGFLTDARYRARSLPPGDERAEYLSENR